VSAAENGAQRARSQMSGKWESEKRAERSGARSGGRAESAAHGPQACCKSSVHSVLCSSLVDYILVAIQ